MADNYALKPLDDANTIIKKEGSEVLKLINEIKVACGAISQIVGENSSGYANAWLNLQKAYGSAEDSVEVACKNISTKLDNFISSNMENEKLATEKVSQTNDSLKDSLSKWGAGVGQTLDKVEDTVLDPVKNFFKSWFD